MADEEGAPRQRGHAVRVAVVEDESLMRWMIRKIVEARPDMVLVHEAAGFAEGRDLVQPGTTDVVVMDIDLGDGASRSPGSCSGATRAWASCSSPPTTCSTSCSRCGTRCTARGATCRRSPRSSRPRLPGRAERAEHARREAEEADLKVRRDVSRRLHGTIQQRLVLLAHRIERLAERDHDPELTAVAEELDEVRERDVRALSHALMPVGVDIGMREALQLALSRLPPTVWTSVTLDPVIAEHLGDPERPRMAVADRLLVLDVVEEAVTNAVRHGGATAIAIRFGLDLTGRPALVLDVDDDGAGPPASPPPSAAWRGCARRSPSAAVRSSSNRARSAGAGCGCTCPSGSRPAPGRRGADVRLGRRRRPGPGEVRGGALARCGVSGRPRRGPGSTSHR